MSDFKVKMHTIRFPLALRPNPAGGAYSAAPDPLAVFKGLSKGRAGKEVGKGRGKERGGVREGRRGKGICRTNVKLLHTRLHLCSTRSWTVAVITIVGQPLLTTLAAIDGRSRHLDRLIRFCRTRSCVSDRQTDRQTDRTPSRLFGTSSAFCDGTSRYGVPENLTTG